MEHWSRAQRHIFGFVAIAVCALTFAYSFYIEREIVADEPGLYNAIYTFVETGRIAYPLHGQPEFMTVHPPTHSLVLGLLMKLGLSLFAAAAVPLVVLTTVIAIVVATGGFPFAIAVALLLAGFSANVIWADYLTVRPDLHLTLAWFAGLVTLEAARNRNWSRWRLALGSVLSVYAATLHYWGIPACAMPLVYAGSAAFTHRHDPRFLAGRLASVAAGGLAVGLPFLIWFVVPRWESIIAVAGGVQGEGGLSAAVERHLDAYSSMLQRSATGWGPRPVVTAFLYPLVALRIPAVIVALLTLMAGRRYTFAVAGSLVPAFVLLYSQGKPTGLTVYYTPEMTLYLTGAFACCFCLVQWVIANTPRPVGRLAMIAAGALGVGSLVQVPSAAGSEWRWTRSLHNLELSRAAGFDVLGSDALVGMISLEPWYIAGARYAWIAANDLTLAQRAGNIEPYLRSVKAFAIDKDWWHALPELAPLGSWYLDGRLSLFGFVLPTSHSGRNQITLFASRHPPALVRGYFLSASGGSLFEESQDGTTAVSTWKCPGPVAEGSFAGSFYRMGFHYNTEPGPMSPTIVVVGSEWASLPSIQHEADGLRCQPRDVVRGRLTFVDATTLLSSLRQQDQSTRIAQTFSDAIAMSRHLERPGEPPSAHRVETTIAWERASIHAVSSSQERTELPIVVKPPARPWGRGATLPLRFDRERSSDMIVRVRARIQGGDAAFGIVPPDDRGFLARAFRESSDEVVTITLFLAAELNPESLTVENGERGSAHTEVELQAVEVFRLDSHGLSSPTPGTSVKPATDR